MQCFSNIGQIRIKIYFLLYVFSSPQSVVVLIQAQDAVAPGGDCEYEGSKVCNGAVTVEKGKFVEICFNGKLKNKLVKKVNKGFPLVGRDTGPGKGTKILLQDNYYYFIVFRLCVVWDSVL